MVAQVEAGEADQRPSGAEPSVGEVLGHLPAAETAYALGAIKAMAGGKQDAVRAAFSAHITAHSNTGLGTAATAEELRRVRERTLRLISGLRDAGLDHVAAELLRSIYRHEADHVAQVGDTLWRTRRRSRLRQSSF